MKTGNINPSPFGLPPRTRLEDDGKGNVTLVKIRKSRIVMKDGEKILEAKRKILKKGKYSSLTLKTNAPVCSKTRAFLEEHGIRIIKTSKNDN